MVKTGCCDFTAASNRFAAKGRYAMAEIKEIGGDTKRHEVARAGWRARISGRDRTADNEPYE